MDGTDRDQAGAWLHLPVQLAEAVVVGRMYPGLEQRACILSREVEVLVQNQNLHALEHSQRFEPG